MARHTALAVVFAVLMMGSMVAAPIGGGVAAADLGPEGDAVAQSNGPGGMVGLSAGSVGAFEPPKGQPDSPGPPGNIPMAAPAQANIPAEAGVWDLQSSAHAGDMNVEIGATPTDRVAFIIGDDTNHDGREVAVNADQLAESVGYRPEVAFGAHSSGDEWKEEIRYEGDKAVFEVPKFSENTVVFSGSVRLQGDSAGDGTQYQYEVDNTSAVDGFTINTTGVTNEAWSNETGVSTTGGSASVSIGGNTDPIGSSANGEPELTLSPNRSTYNPVHDEGDGNTEYSIQAIAGDSNIDTTDNSEVRVEPTKSGDLNELSVGAEAADGSNSGITIDIYLVQATPDDNHREGTQIKSNWQPEFSSGTKTIPLDTIVSIDKGSTYTIEFVADGTDNDGTNDKLYWASDDSATSPWIVEDGSEHNEYPDIDLSIGTAQVSNVDVSDSGGNTVSFGDITDQKTKEIPWLASDTSALEIGGSGGDVTYDLSVKERTQTSDPVVELNGHTTSHTGTLADGETVSLTANESWVEEGTNTVNISTNSPPSGPESLVGLDYSHEVGGPGQSTTVDATSWGEVVNSTRTYPSDTENPEVAIALNDRVASVEAAEYRVNGSSWQAVPSSEYTGTTLTATLPDVSAGTTVDVRANGSKVRAVTGAFTVTEPTTPGNPLTSTIRADEVGDSGQLSIGVEGTEHGNKAHYVSDSGWSDDSRMVYTASGNANLVMPNAEPGREASLRTAPINASPSSGPVEITDVDGDQDKPEFTVVSDSDNPVDYTFTDAEDGQYELYDTTADQQLDTGEASSPVTLTAEGDLSGHTLVIRPYTEPAQAGPAPIENGGVVSTAVGAFPTDVVPFLLAGLLGLGVVGVVYRRRTTDTTPKSGGSGGNSGRTGRSSLISRVPGSAFIGGVYGSVRSALGGLPLSSVVGRVWDTATNVLKLLGGAVWRLSAFAGAWAFSAGKTRAKTAGGWLAARLRRPAIGLGALSVAGMIAIRAGIISPTDEVRLLLAAVAALIGAAVALRAVGLLTWQYYSVVAAATFLLVGEAVSPGSIAPAIGNGIEEVFPIIAIVGAYLIVRRVRSGGGLTGGGSGGSGGEGSDDDPDVTIVTQGATVDDSASGEGGD